MRKGLAVCISVLLVLTMMPLRPAVAADPIKIGVVVTLTGMAAQLGIDNRNGILLAAKHKGTILGRPIQIITEDDEGQSETGIRKAEKLVFKDKVVALSGVTVANVGQAIAGEADRLNVPFLTTNVMTPKFYGLHPLVFRCGQVADDQMTVAQVMGILKSPDLMKRSWYVLADDYAWGHSCAEEFIKLATEKGIKIKNPTYDNAALNLVDWSPFITKIISAEVGGVYACLRSPVAPRFVQQASDFGLMEKVKIIGGTPSEAALEAAGESVVGLIGTCCWTWDIDTPKSKAFADAYWKEFKEVPPSQGAQAYTGAMVLFNAIEKAGGTDPKKIAEALKGATFDGPYGVVRISPKDNCMRTPVKVVVAEKAPKNPFGAKIIKKVVASLTPEEVGPAE